VILNSQLVIILRIVVTLRVDVLLDLRIITAAVWTRTIISSRRCLLSLVGTLAVSNAA